MNFDRLHKAASRVHCWSETRLGAGWGWGLQERGVFLGSLKAVTPEMDGKLDRL